MIHILLPIFLLDEEEPPRRAPLTEREQFQQKVKLEAEAAAYFQNLQEEILPQIRAALVNFTRVPSISKLFRLKTLLQELQYSLEQNFEVSFGEITSRQPLRPKFNAAGNAHKIYPKLLALVYSMQTDLPSWLMLWYWQRNGANLSSLLYDFQDLEQCTKSYKGRTFITRD